MKNVAIGVGVLIGVALVAWYVTKPASKSGAPNPVPTPSGPASGANGPNGTEAPAPGVTEPTGLQVNSSVRNNAASLLTNVVDFSVIAAGAERKRRRAAGTAVNVPRGTQVAEPTVTEGVAALVRPRREFVEE